MTTSASAPRASCSTGGPSPGFSDVADVDDFIINLNMTTLLPVSADQNYSGTPQLNRFCPCFEFFNLIIDYH